MKTLTILSLLIVSSIVLKAQKISTTIPAGDEKQLDLINYGKEKVTFNPQNQIPFDSILARYHPVFQLKLKSHYRFRTGYNWANPSISTNDTLMESDPGILFGPLPSLTSSYIEVIYATKNDSLKMVMPAINNSPASTIPGFTNRFVSAIKRADLGFITNLQIFLFRNFTPGIRYNICLNNPDQTNGNYTAYVPEKFQKLFLRSYNQ